MNYKRIVKTNHSAERSAEQPRRLPAGTRVDLAAVFDLSEVPPGRKHFYVYSILLLIMLLAHTLRNSGHSSPAATGSAVSDEVAKFMEIGAWAKDIY
jgi:hypothetical protein